MEETRSNFAELNPLLILIGVRKGNDYILKRELAEQKIEINLNEDQIKKDLKDLECDVQRS